MRQVTPSFLLTALLLSLPLGARAADTPATQPAAYTHEAALSLYRQGKYAADEALCKAAIADLEKSDGPNSPKLWPPLNDLAEAYLRVGRFSDARPLITRAESVLDKSTRDGALAYAHLCINKGWLEYSLGDISKAEAIFKEGRDLIRKYETKSTVDLAELINNIGLAYADNEDEDPAKIKQAKLLLFKSWEMRRLLTGENSPETAESLNNIGMHLLFHPDGESDIATALTTLQKSVALAEKVYGKDNPETAMASTNLAAAHHLLQQDDLALPEIQNALAITEKFMGKGSPDRAYELQVLGQIYQTQQKYKDAEAAYQEALTITKNCYGPTNIAVAASLDYLSSLYEAMGDEKKQAETKKQITKLRGRDI
ncbi:MAG TPA: tetratricopeptide repeat protein [Phycisphaerae bacterium]|nr:tetratricopeptide repeat protein [Phycisphaerae bacterium]